MRYKPFSFILIVTVLICLTFLPAVGQEPPPSGAPMTGEAALLRAQNFLQVCGLPPPSATARLELNSIYSPAPVWEVAWPGDYDVDVDADTGNIIDFRNARRANQREHNTGRTGAHRFDDLDQASEEVWRLARAVGLPPTAYLSSLEFRTNGDFEQKDRNPVDVSAGFSWSFEQPGPDYGILGLRAGESGKPGLSLQLDDQDGQLMGLSQSLKTVPVPSSVNLTEQQATQAAVTAYGWWASHGGDSSLQTGDASPSSAPELGYISLSAVFDFVHGVMPQSTYPMRLRLVWGVYFPAASIFITADDGTVVGGMTFKGAIGKGGAPKSQAKTIKAAPKFSLRQLLQDAQEIRISPIHSAAAAPKQPGLMLNGKTRKPMYLAVKRSGHFQSGGPALVSYRFVLAGKGKPVAELKYDDEAGILGKDDQWCFVPNAFRSWMKTLRAKPAAKPQK